jgi:hypothetical protein
VCCEQIAHCDMHQNGFSVGTYSISADEGCVFYPDKLRKTAEIMAAFALLNAAEQAEMKTVQCRECFMRQAVQGGVNGGGSEIKTAWMFGTCSLDRNSEFCQDKLRTHCLRNCK